MKEPGDDVSQQGAGVVPDAADMKTMALIVGSWHHVPVPVSWECGGAYRHRYGMHSCFLDVTGLRAGLSARSLGPDMARILVTRVVVGLRSNETIPST